MRADDWDREDSNDGCPCEELDRIIALTERLGRERAEGRRPAFEHWLGEVAEPWRPRLARELIRTEVELRRATGETPHREDYAVRFTDQAAWIEKGLPKRPRPSSIETAKGLLFGLLAMQNGFIGRDALLVALNDWAADKSKPLGQWLIDRGALDADQRQLLDGLVAHHLKKHDGDPEKSLADLSSLGPTREALLTADDEAIRTALYGAGRKSSSPPTDPDATIDQPGDSGRRAGHRFRILRPHAKGGMGVVYVARDEELGRDVALKEIQDKMAGERQVRSRFVVEAEIAGGLQHPNIVPIYSLGTYDDGKPFYAMRFVEGASLRDTVEKYHREHPKPDPSTKEFRELLARFLDVCNAVAFAHSKGVLHRDLKPHNIMIGHYGEALIIDWGLAKATGKSDQQSAGGRDEATLVPPSGSGLDPTQGPIGTPSYMSPEQARGENDKFGNATDVYALGAILYHLLTGSPPVSGGGPREVLDRAARGEIALPRLRNPNVPRSLEAVCMKALAKEPGDRYATARAGRRR
ncbi:MAG: serine/threonine-protein kinase [Isosphaeraceae bacterium]